MRPTTPASDAPRDARSRRVVALTALVGTPAARDVTRGLALLRLACEAGDACACLERAAALETFDGRAEALGEAARHYERLCESASKTRCVSPVTAAPGTAFAARTSSAGAPVEMLACYNWSALLGRGVLTAPDAADAEVLTKRACAGGLAVACAKGS